VDKRENTRLLPAPFAAGTVFISTDQVPGNAFCESSGTITVDSSRHWLFPFTVLNANKIQNNSDAQMTT
jgi:hypothetical protein